MGTIEEIERYYKKNNDLYGVGSPKNLWISEDRQLVRFDKLLTSLFFNEKSIFDVGCGYCDFYFYLLRKGISLKAYSGVELLKEHYDVAVSKLPSGMKIYHGDFLKTDVPAKEFDIFVMSGLLNFYASGWKKLALNVVDKMWLLAKETIVFNVKSQFGEFEPKSALPSFWCRYAESKTTNFALYHNYLCDDFIIVMSKKGSKKNE